MQTSNIISQVVANCTFHSAIAATSTLIGATSYIYVGEVHVHVILIAAVEPIHFYMYFQDLVVPG